MILYSQLYLRYHEKMEIFNQIVHGLKIGQSLSNFTGMLIMSSLNTEKISSRIGAIGGRWITLMEVFL